MSSSSIGQIVAEAYENVVLGKGTERLFFGPNWAVDVPRRPLFSGTSPFWEHLLGMPSRYARIAYTFTKNGRTYVAESSYRRPE